MRAIGFDAVNIYNSPADLSLSGAGVASKNSKFNSPAISKNNNSTISFSSNRWIQNFSGNSLLLSVDNFRLLFNSIGVEDIKVYDETPSDSPLDIIGSHYLSFGLSKGYDYESYTFGLGANFLYSHLFTEDLHALTFDLGLKKKISDNFRIGILGKNLSHKESSVPKSYAIGCSLYNVSTNTEVLLDYNHSSIYKNGFHFGLIQKVKLFNINAGYSTYESRTTFSSGIEVSVNKKYHFLYSILSIRDSNLGLSHYFGIEIAI